jgi:hypothetical protein
MDKELKNLQMVLFLLEFLNKTKEFKEDLHYVIHLFMKVLSYLIFQMDMEFINGLMELDMRETGI